MHAVLPVLLLQCAVAFAYRHGDVVSMMKRSQYKQVLLQHWPFLTWHLQMRTDFSEMSHKDAPRFGVESTIKLNWQGTKAYNSEVV